ncbi:hypothetical protein VPNG_00556 [Cytospora leucostoma]|uniref:Uncharacterized protein n=1 Tax=Cytospora leucostoma TaxID=1230097 RepID=A0A423XMN9_9PEZI|nr:hypothetical protein VPNG_00556 [Cytospora leucostoma]
MDEVLARSKPGQGRVDHAVGDQNQKQTQASGHLDRVVRYGVRVRREAVRCGVRAGANAMPIRSTQAGM